MSMRKVKTILIVVIFIIMMVFVTQTKANPMAYGKPGIRVVLQTDGAAGKLYFHDEVGNIILATNISSGAEGFRTPSGTYKVYYKKKYHMSTKYPEDNGINNMDYSLFFRGGFLFNFGPGSPGSPGSPGDEAFTFRLYLNKQSYYVTFRGNFKFLIKRATFNIRNKIEEVQSTQST